MRLAATLLSFSLMASNGFAHGDHDEDGPISGEGPGLEIEDGACVGFTGHAGESGPFRMGSEEMELSVDIASCNVCLRGGLSEETCLDEEARSSALSPFIAQIEQREGRRVGAEIIFTLSDEDSTMIGFVCHFHDYASGEIDCH